MACTSIKAVLIISLFSVASSLEWMSNGDSHYAFVKQAKSAYDAQAFCSKSAARVAQPKNSDEDAWLQRMARSLGGNEWWLGISAAKYDGGKRDFVGVNGALNFTNWAAGEPNNYMPWLGAEDCVTLDTRTKGWNDNRCTTLLWFICEDINECEDYPDLCWSHKCINEIGNYRCQS